MSRQLLELLYMFLQEEKKSMEDAAAPKNGTESIEYHEAKSRHTKMELLLSTYWKHHGGPTNPNK